MKMDFWWTFLAVLVALAVWSCVKAGVLIACKLLEEILP